MSKTSEEYLIHELKSSKNSHLYYTLGERETAGTERLLNCIY